MLRTVMTYSNDSDVRDSKNNIPPPGDIIVLADSLI